MENQGKSDGSFDQDDSKYLKNKVKEKLSPCENVTLEADGPSLTSTTWRKVWQTSSGTEGDPREWVPG